jgi:hypothetical protein
MGWMGQWSNPSGDEIFRTCPDQPWGPPNFLHNGYGSLPGVKWPGRGIYHPAPSGAEIKVRVELYLYSPSGPLWPVLGWTLPWSLFIGISPFRHLLTPILPSLPFIPLSWILFSSSLPLLKCYFFHLCLLVQKQISFLCPPPQITILSSLHLQSPIDTDFSHYSSLICKHS